MHSLKISTVCLLSLACMAASAQGFPDERYKVKLTISDSVPVLGGQELAAMLASQPDQNAVLDTPPPTLVRGRTYQLKVTITDPTGTTKAYTRSPQLRYETFNCLTVSSLGVMNVTPIAGATCANPDSPELWVVLTDSAGNPIAMNSYMFHVTPRRRDPRRD